MRFAMQLTFSDFPHAWGISERTWGESGVRSLIDSVYDTGIRTLLWRTPGFPSKGEFAEVRYFDEELEKSSDIDFRWETLKIAVEYAHSKGMAIWSWYDQEDSHGGCGGRRKHGEFILHHPDLIRKPRRGGLFNEIEVQEHRDPNCPLIGLGTQGSLSYREVQDFRLSIIREVVEYGMDGVYIVNKGSIGYEEPIVGTFRKKYGLDANELPEDDSRWVSHQGEVLTEYLRRVRDLLNSFGRRIGLALESRGTKKSLPGLLPYVASQSRLLVEENILDYLSVWTCEDVLALGKLLDQDLSHVARRFEVFTIPPIERWWLFQGAGVMRDLGVSLFCIDEATNVEPDRWGLIEDLVSRYGD